MSRSTDNTLVLAATVAAGYWAFFTDQGKAFTSGLFQTGAAKAPAQGADTGAWTVYKDGITGQIWANNATTQKWAKVNGTSDYAKYGVPADGSTIQTVPPDAAGAWFSQSGYLDASQNPAVGWFLRSDTSGSGINAELWNGGTSLNTGSIPGNAKSNLSALIKAGQVAPQNVHALALLNKLGIM